MRRLVAFSFALCIARSAQAADTSALALELSPAYSRQIVPSVSHANETEHRNGGPSIVLGASYRSGYFPSPFVESGWFSVYSSNSSRNVPGFGAT